MKNTLWYKDQKKKYVIAIYYILGSIEKSKHNLF